jgi:hypothetical protein
VPEANRVVTPSLEDRVRQQAVAQDRPAERAVMTRSRQRSEMYQSSVISWSSKIM